MALSFKINRHHNDGKLCLKLSGDFDGSSAAELVWVLRSYDDRPRAIVIDTGALKSMHPFGLEIFKRKYRQVKNDHLTWSGKHAAVLSTRDESII